MLTSLTLENFKRHKKLHIDFKRGVNVILGANYTGKSTVLEAIAFAFGGVQAVNVNSSSLAHFDGGRMKVVVNFEAQGKDWVLMRSENSASLESDSGDVATGKTGVNSLLDEIIGLERKLFNILRYSKQGDTSQLLSEGETKLTRMIEELSGVDIMDAVLSNLRVHKSQIDSTMEGLMFNFELTDELVETMRSEIASGLHELAILEGRIEAASDTADKLKQERKDLAVSIAEVIEAQKENTRIEQNTERLNARISAQEEAKAEAEASLAEANNGLEGWDILEAKLEQYQKTAARRSELEQRKLDLLESIEIAKANIENSDNMIADLEDTNAQHRKAQALLKKPDEVKLLSDKLSELKEELRALDSIIENGACPECNRPYDNQEKAVEDAKSQYSGVSEQVESLSKLYDEAATDLVEYDGIARMIADNSETIARHEGRRAESLDYVRGKELELENVEILLTDIPETDSERIDRLASQVGIMNRHRVDKERAESTIDNCNSRIKEFRNKLKEIPDSVAVNGDLEAMQAERADYDTTISLHVQEVNTMSRQHTELAAEVRNKQRSVKRYEDVKIEVLKNEDKLDKVKRLSKFLRDNRSSLIHNLWNSILSQASKICSMITGGAIDQITKTEELGLCYSEGGIYFPVASGSGCQRAVMGVAIRSAISRTFAGNLRFMLLDEITADMDEEHASATMAILPKINDQIVYITHRSADLRDNYHTTEL